MKITFTPAALQTQDFPAGTDGSGALVVSLDMGAGATNQPCDGTTPVVFAGVADGSGTLTYGRRMADDSGWLGTPFTVPVTVASPVQIAMPVGGTVDVSADA